VHGCLRNARRIEPDEERLVVLLGLIHEIDREVADFIVHRFHALGIERAGVLDPLQLAPRCIGGNSRKVWISLPISC
jgi:hypothetical protein